MFSYGKIGVSPLLGTIFQDIIVGDNTPLDRPQNRRMIPSLVWK